MKPDEREALLRLYADRHNLMGYDIRTIGWKNQAEQQLRFQILCDIGDLTDCSVMDVGCGFGDLADYLDARFDGVRYTGVDISPPLVEEARKLRPNLDFHCVDILDEGFAESVDYILLSGALSYKIDDNWSFAQRMLEKMYHLANKGVAANFLSSYVNYQHPRNFYYSPEQMFAIGKSLSRRVSLRHDYPLYEFTMFVYHEDANVQIDPHGK